MKRVIPVLASLLLIGLFSAGVAQTSAGGDDKKIEMVPIKMKDLLAHAAAQKGKVVIIDLWGFFCGPCKEEFPNLVRLHHTYGTKGLVCISLSMDFNEPLKRRALEFLKEKKAVCANYWLEEGIEAAQKQWKFDAIPVVVVYGKDGKVARVFNNDDASKDPFTYKQVEELVKKLLATK